MYRTNNYFPGTGVTNPAPPPPPTSCGVSPPGSTAETYPWTLGVYIWGRPGVLYGSLNFELDGSWRWALDLDLDLWPGCFWPLGKCADTVLRLISYFWYNAIGFNDFMPQRKVQ
jgi:hypothetical protein